MLNNAFDALKKFDWGSDLAGLAPIEDAIISSHDKVEARQELENRFVSLLKDDLSRDARDYICRKLATIGTAASVSVLGSLLKNPESSHMSRFALERIPAPQAAAALRDALSTDGPPQLTAEQKIGLMSSLGARRDSASAELLGRFLTDNHSAVARAAALALGAIGTNEAVAVLRKAVDLPNINRPAIIDAMFSCAEALLADHQRAQAMTIYTAFTDPSQPRIVRLAATRGLLACTSKQA